MSNPPKGSVILATGDGKVSYVSPTTNDQILVLDSNEPSGAKFIDITTIIPHASFKVGASDSPYTTSTSYEVLMTFTVPGETIAPIQTIEVLSKKESNITSYDIRIFDADNSNTIAETNFTNANLASNDMGVLSNLPANKAIFEVQAKKNGGSGNARIQINECNVIL